ncbi:MAG TPA: hypothetical protein VH186_33870 [Chloroflexia bacterium]|nr:hypothetical protein [Chloroflexia bacterium]
MVLDQAAGYEAARADKKGHEAGETSPGIGVETHEEGDGVAALDGEGKTESLHKGVELGQEVRGLAALDVVE